MPPAAQTVHLAAAVLERVQALDVSLGAEPAGGSQRHAGCHLRISITSRITEGSPAHYSAESCHCTRLALMRCKIFPRGLVSAVLKHACWLAAQEERTSGRLCSTLHSLAFKQVAQVLL